MNPALADAYTPVPNVYPPVADRIFSRFLENHFLSLVCYIQMALLRGLHAATFQVEVFRWLVVFIHRDALDGGIGSEILQVVEGYHAGGFILLDVVERTGGQGALVELHLGETVDVLAVFACVVGWERVVLKTQGIFIPGMLVGVVVATVCLVDNETIGRHHHYS